MIILENFLKMELEKVEKSLYSTKLRYGTLDEKVIANTASYNGAKLIGELEGKIETLRLIIKLITKEV